MKATPNNVLMSVTYTEGKYRSLDELMETLQVESPFMVWNQSIYLIHLVH